MSSRGAVSPRVLMCAAAGILLVTMGIRQSLGLFVLPIVATTGLSIMAVSFALAIGQLVWGAAQPLFGAIADQYGAYRVMMVGGLLLACGAALAPFAHSAPGFVASLGFLMAAGAAAGSFAILIGTTAQYLPPGAALGGRRDHQCRWLPGPAPVCPAHPVTHRSLGVEICDAGARRVSPRHAAAGVAVPRQ